jgi:Na+-transporting NADH:ubiquinone oxidoreductase subunit C
MAKGQPKDTPVRALLTVLVTAVICSSIVSASVVLLRPIQLNNKLLERSRNIVALTGQLPQGGASDEVLLELFKSLDARVVDIDEPRLDTEFDAYTFDARKAAVDPQLSEAIPPEKDRAALGRRSRYQTIYLVWKDGALQRVILPIHGAGMWSMLYGYLALESDLNTIAGTVFYEQNETPGLGDQITDRNWQSKWKGKQLFDHSGELLFHIAEGPVKPGSAAADYQVDALTGATVTSNAVTALVQYWLGPDGYGPLLAQLKTEPPVQAAGLAAE